MPLKAARCAIVSMTLAGFSLAGSARASSGSSSSGSSSSGSSSSSGGSSGSATATTALVSVASTVAGVVITVAVIRASRRGKGDWGQGWSNSERARALLDSGIIDTRSNLGVEVGLVMSDPDAFERMSGDVAVGNGTTLSAVAEAANLSPSVVGRHWRDTRAAFGDVSTEQDAFRFSLLFMARLARDLTVDPDLAAGMLWDLARERTQPNFPEDADTHKWLANWMGVPMRSAITATDFAFSNPGGPLPPELRGQIYADPTSYLDRLSSNIGNRHPKEVDDRVRGLVDNVRPWWPLEDTIDAPANPPEVRTQEAPVAPPPEDESDKPEGVPE